MSELYQLPNGWEWKKLGDISILIGGGTPKRNIDEYWINGDIIWLSPTDLGKIGDVNEISNSKDKINQLGLDKSSAKLLPIGTVLYSSRATIGKIAINTIEVSTNQGFTNFVCNDDLNNRYLAFCLSRFTEDITSLSNSTTFKEVSKTSLKEFKIPLPPLSEQQRIVSKLDLLFEKIDKSIALHQKNMDEADVFMGSVLNDVFGELEENNNPMLRFDTYTKLSRGHNPPKKDFIYEEKEGYLRFIQIRDGSSDKNAVYVPITKKLHLVTKEDLLLVAYRQVGKVFREMEGAFNVALCKIENKDYNKLDTNYLYYIIQSKYVKDELLSRSERALIPSMSVDHLKSIKIPTPQLQIQQKVVKYLDEISQKIEKIKQAQKAKMNSLKALKASILDQAFKGEL
jgi:type I restriction enzyme, S subunit